MKKRMLIAGILCTMMLALAGAKEKEELSDAGKNGPITVKVGKHMTVTSIDGQPTKLKGKIKIEPGKHIIKIKYAHYTDTAAITGTGFKNFYFKEGCEYSMISYEHRISRDSGVLNIVIRDKKLSKIEDTINFTNKVTPPETQNGKDVVIDFDNKWPEEGTYEIVGEISYKITSGIWIRGSVTEEIRYLYFKEFLAEKGIDIVEELEEGYNEFTGFWEFSGIGLKKVEK